MPDLRWTSLGGTLLDGNGDWALATEMESTLDMVRTRLKADLHGWKLYPIGADLDKRIGDTMGPELEAATHRQIYASLTFQLLPPGSFRVELLSSANIIDAYVYLEDTLVATVKVDRNTGVSRIV